MNLSKIYIVFCFVGLSSQAQFDQIKDLISSDGSTNFTEEQAVKAIKTTLTNGVTKEVERLTLENGFYGNNLVKIEFPENLQNVERKLRLMGLDDLIEKAVRSLNKTAEEATKKAIPIFTSAITSITIEDGISIIKGGQNAATSYLKSKTYRKLYDQMSPIVEEQFSKVQADVVWSQLTSTYNKLPFSKEVNPDLIDYVTKEALRGIFKSIAKEELEIREQLDARTSNILKVVFGQN